MKKIKNKLVNATISVVSAILMMKKIRERKNTNVKNNSIDFYLFFFFNKKK